MSRITASSDVSYAYLGTLARLDANGDGALSRSERAVEERPGILQTFNEHEDSANYNNPAKFSSSVLTFMMESSAAGRTSVEPQNGTFYSQAYSAFDYDMAS